MGKDHLGHPSGVNKSEDTGNSAAKNDQRNKQVTEKYMSNEDTVGDNVSKRHANRNMIKINQQDQVAINSKLFKLCPESSS